MGGVTTQYYLSGGQIVGMKQGSDVMQFVYDPDGQPFMMRLNGTDYYYTYNAQGDVVSLIDRSNTRVVEYQYDSWGKPTLISDTSADFVMISQKSLPERA